MHRVSLLVSSPSGVYSSSNYIIDLKIQNTHTHIVWENIRTQPAPYRTTPTYSPRQNRTQAQTVHARGRVGGCLFVGDWQVLQGRLGAREIERGRE